MLDSYLKSNDLSRGRSDVVAIVDGIAVCFGDMRYVADSIGISYDSLRKYKSNRPVPGLEVLSLPEMWLVEGFDAAMTTDQVIEALRCDKSDLSDLAIRMRWVNRSLPTKVIDALRRREKSRRLASKRASNIEPISV